VDVEVRWAPPLPVLVVRFPAAARAVASTVLGGGLGPRHWVVNASVAPDYSRRDPERHLADIARALALRGPGCGMLTAADVRGAVATADDGVAVVGTVGLGHPILAAAPDHLGADRQAGTINLVAWVPARLTDAALVNAVATATEAKAQALHDLGLDATGTATDAVVVACPAHGPTESFGGPRSLWGARLARAAYSCVTEGGTR